jgi:hypothetical protein
LIAHADVKATVGDAKTMTDETTEAPPHRYLVETPDAEYWADDFRIGPKFGGLCTFLIRKTLHGFVVSEIYNIVAIHDFNSGITPEEFAAQTAKDAECFKQAQIDIQNRLLQPTTPQKDAAFQ